MRKKTIAPKNALKAAVNVFAFVHDYPEKPETKRVNAILELLAGIQRRKLSFDEKAGLIDRLQKALRRYRWTREILWGHPGDDPKRYGPHVFVTSAERGVDAWEYGAVHVLLTIAEHCPDYLSKIGRCEVCPRWMLTRKSDHTCCSGKCRQYKYDNSAGRREQHRANMRRLYRQEKESQQRAKIWVGFSQRAAKRCR